MKNKLLLVVLMAVILSLGFTKVMAEELTPTDTGSYFETKILPYIAGGGSGAVASLVGFLGLIRKSKKNVDDTTKKVTETTQAAVDKVNNATSVLEKQANRITEVQTFVTEKIGGLNDDIKSFKESSLQTISEQRAMIEAQTAVIQGFQSQITKITTDQAKATKAILIGFGNNAEMVKNGYAKEICALMEKEQEAV